MPVATSNRTARLLTDLTLVSVAHILARVVGWDGTDLNPHLVQLLWAGIALVTVLGLYHLARSRNLGVNARSEWP